MVLPDLKPKHGVPRKSYATPKDESKMDRSAPSPSFDFDSHKKQGKILKGFLMKCHAVLSFSKIYCDFNQCRK